MKVVCMGSAGSASIMNSASIGGMAWVTLAWTLFALDLAIFAKMRALRAGVMGPVRIRACVDMRLVRMGPAALEAGATGSLGIEGGITAAAGIGLRV